MSAHAAPTLGPSAVDWHGPHTCPRCLAAGRPAAWHHVLVVDRACPMERVADCLDCRRALLPGAARQAA